MNVQTIIRPEEQLSPGQGSIRKHTFIKSDGSEFGSVGIDLWKQEKVLLISGKIEVYDKRKGHGTQILEWLIQEYQGYLIRPVHLTNEGSHFWSSMVDKFPSHLDPNDWSGSEYVENCNNRTLKY